ncbi:MAG: hypothetical protein JWN98_1497 [Abditibacteriota bacterium]|nr:hypothetical protein [Abditibacteriota bacterium]
MRRKLLAITGTAIGFAACYTTVAYAQRPAASTGRTFGDTVGLNVKYSQGEPQSDLPLLKELGVKWVRDTITWSEVEPSEGRLVGFPAAFQERLNFYKANNIGIDVILAYENSTAYPASPENPLNPINAPAYGRYAAHVARLLKASGVRFVLEIWNEPHNFIIAKMAGGEWNAKSPSPWVDHYLKMVASAVEQVKAVDPQIKLLSQDDMWIIHYWFLEQGLPKALDGISFHPYWNEGSVGPEMTAVGQETSWTKPFTVVDDDRSLHSAVRRLREQAQIKMGKTPAMWSTEVGAAIGNKTRPSMLTPDGVATEDAIAAYVPRTFITSANAGIEATFWFSSYDSVDGPMGLRANDGTRRKAFGAFKTMTQQLNAYTLARHVIGHNHRTSGAQAYHFRGPQGDKHVLWNVDGQADFVVTSKTRGAVQITDLQGRTVPLKKMADNRVVLSLSQSPIYVNGLQSTLTIERAPSPVATNPVYLFR